MKIKRILFLVVLLGLLVLPARKSVHADAGGACLGEWSECRMNCESSSLSNQLWLQQCYSRCDARRYICLNGYTEQDPVDGGAFFAESFYDWVTEVTF